MLRLSSLPSPRPRPEPELPVDDFMCDDIDSYLIAMETSDIAGPSHKLQPQPQTSSTNRKSHPLSEEEEEEPVERPPNKKVLQRYCILKSHAYLISCYSSRFHSLVVSSARFSLAPCCRLVLSRPTRQCRVRKCSPATARTRDSQNEPCSSDALGNQKQEKTNG